MERRFPNRLKRYRRIVGLSQKQAAKLLELKDTSLLCRWEMGHAIPTAVHLMRLCILYKAEPRQLYLELWQSLQQQIECNEADLLARREPFISD